MQLVAEEMYSWITRCTVAGLTARMALSVHGSSPVLWAGTGFPAFEVLVAVPAWKIHDPVCHWIPGARLQVALAVTATCREHGELCCGLLPQLTAEAAATLWTQKSLRPWNLLFLPVPDFELLKTHPRMPP